MARSLTNSTVLTSEFAESKHALEPDIRQYADRDEYEYDSDSYLDEAGFDDLEDDNDSESFTDSRSSTPSFSTAIDPRGKNRDETIYISTPDIPIHRILLPSVAYRTYVYFV